MTVRTSQPELLGLVEVVAVGGKAGRGGAPGLRGLPGVPGTGGPPGSGGQGGQPWDQLYIRSRGYYKDVSYRCVEPGGAPPHTYTGTHTSQLLYQLLAGSTRHAVSLDPLALRACLVLQATSHQLLPMALLVKMAVQGEQGV